MSKRESPLLFDRFNFGFLAVAGLHFLGYLGPQDFAGLQSFLDTTIFVLFAVGASGSWHLLNPDIVQNMHQYRRQWSWVLANIAVLAAIALSVPVTVSLLVLVWIGALFYWLIIR